ncbi:MAG: peptidoglycan-associated lipoprotein Pal [Desulfobacteraceae bacterium]
MKKRVLVSSAMVLLAAGLMLTVSCAKKSVVSDPAAVQVDTEEETAAEAEAEAEAAAKAKELARQQAIEEEQIKEEAARKARAAAEKQAAERQEFENRNVHFDYDSSRLTDEAKRILKEKAAWLRNNPGVTVVVEGHCDERGLTEYNLALGERRAMAARQYLVDSGISPSRLTTISYGEEKPLDPAHNPAAWAKNRRAQFSIK